MTFTRYNPSGYNDGERFPAAAYNHIDLNQSRALDGYAGGSWSPTALITLAGSGLSVTGPFSCTDMRSSQMQSGYTFTFQSGAYLSIAGTGQVSSGANLNVLSGGTLSIFSGGKLDVASGGIIEVASGGAINFAIPTEATCAGHVTSKIFTAADFQLGDTDGDGSIEWQAFNNGSNSYAKALSTDDHIQQGLAAVPDRGVISSIVATVQGDPGSHSGLPASPPDLRLYRQDSNGALTLEDSQVDTSTTVGAYEAVHPITLSALSEPVRSAGGTDQCFVMLTNEGSTNAQPGLRVMRIKVSFTIGYIASYF